MATGQKKKYKIRSINFGKPGDASRELLEQYEKKFGEMKTSELVRSIIVTSLSSDPIFNSYKVKQLTNERKLIQKDLKEIQRRLIENSDKLEALGVDPCKLDL